MRIYSRDDVISLKVSEKQRPRLNLHQTYDDKVQKMLFVMRPGEERTPHANMRELTQVVLAGDADLLIYDETGKELLQKIRISPEENFAYTLEAGLMHTKAVRKTLVLFEVIEGPYVGTSDLKVAA